ncbi:hypothetical protein BGW39_001806 [Mortierella sp. 14UC]|nr:hypothetical protein BGW39_001806 [Mortierella sp. 14UC]
MKFTNALVVLAAVAVSSVSAQYTSLINGTIYPIQYTASNYTVSPSPMCHSQPFCLIATGTLSTDIIEGATYDILGRAYGRIMYSDNHNLCASLQPAEHPALFPLIPYEFQFTAVNGDGARLFVQQTPKFGVYPPQISDPRLRIVACA